MAAINALEFNPATVKLGNNYLLLGSDAFSADTVADQIRRKLKESSDADLVIFYGDEAKAALLNDLLDTYSIFSTAKMVLLRNAETLKKPELDSLGEYFKSPSEVQSLIIVADKIDARTAGWKKIKDACQTVICDPPRWGAQMSPWLNKVLPTLGKTMTSKAAELFISRVELDYASAYNELQKLVLLTLDRKQITDSDVARSIGSSRVGTAIDFYRALGNKQIRQSLELMEKMLSSDWAALQIFFNITRFSNIVYSILLLKKNHFSPNEIMSSHMNDIFTSQRQEFMKFSANYTIKQMETIFGILLDTDTKIKTSVASENILLTNCILQMLGTK